MLKIIGSIISLFVIWFKSKTERDVEKKKKKKELLNEAKQAIKNGDTSTVTNVFDRVRRL